MSWNRHQATAAPRVREADRFIDKLKRRGQPSRPRRPKKTDAGIAKMIRDAAAQERRDDENRLM